MPAIIALLIITFSFLIAVTFHEFSHAALATLLGDDTPKRAGRLTLNPLKHIDPMGILFLLLFRIGWAIPVPFNPNNFNRPQLYSVLVGLAGPASNFLLALVAMYFLKYLTLGFLVLKTFYEFLVYVNIMLGIFNVLPMPPLDGSHILYVLLPRRLKFIYHMLSTYSIFIFILIFALKPSRILFFSAIEQVRVMLSFLVI